MSKVTTLAEFIIERQAEFTGATGELSRLLTAIRLAAKIVNREVNKAGLVDILGAMGQENVQGEQQQKLDVFANETFMQALEAQGEVCAVASEEDDDIVCFESSRSGKYIIMMDPLDGSSNIDVNVSIGTIFSICKRLGDAQVGQADFMQKGVEQVAAGYVIYGSSTMLVYTTGHGVNGFTLDPSIGVFCLSHPDMKIPDDGKIYSINEGNLNQFSEGVRRYVEHCQSENNDQGKPYTARYIGSLVADLHRNLIKGGIYIYPSTKTAPNGKLRLLYECNPMGMIIEQAGGMATDGRGRILEITPTELHQRVPFFVGSKHMVQKAHEFIAQHG